MTKIVLITAASNDYYDNEPEINIKEVTLKELLEDTNNYAIRAEFEQLVQARLKTMLDKDKQLAFNKQMYMRDSPNSSHICEVSLYDLPEFRLNQLACGSKLLQEVNIKSALSVEQYKEYQKYKKRHDEEVQKSALVKQKREARKKATELAKAAKLLTANGITVVAPEEKKAGKQ